MKEILIAGPPGTGKTHKIQEIVRAMLTKRVKSDQIALTSFTKTGAVQLAKGSAVHRSGIGTLHSFAFRGLGLEKSAVAESHLDQWNKDRPGWQLSGGVAVDFDDGGATEISQGATDADEYMAQMGVLRARCVAPDAWPPQIKRFAALWSEWKSANSFIDFSDMIELGLQVETMPVHYNDNTKKWSGPKVLFGDEFQDFTMAERKLFDHWGQNCDMVLKVGDADQCQPAGTKVLTSNRGYVNIEDLNPASDLLVSYDRAKSYIVGMSKGYKFQIASRPFNKFVYSIKAGDKETFCTSEHKWLVKWDKELTKNTHVVYLMQKGDRFRIGWCKLFNSENAFHLGIRARLENADKAWILKVTDNAREASAWESYLAAFYGLPLITFRSFSLGHYSQETINFVFNEFPKGELRKRADLLLRRNNLNIDYPIYDRAKAWERHGGQSILTVETYNLISGLMLVPAHIEDSNKVEWCQLWKSTTDNGPDKVYSLEVEKHNLYIADGLVTHNCLYGFKGADPDGMYRPDLPDMQKRVLNQSHRVPIAVHTEAQKLIRNIKNRDDVIYHPRPEQGVFRRDFPASFQKPARLIGAIESDLADGLSVGVMASCGYMLQNIIFAFKQAGLPFCNTYRKNRGDWNVLTPGSGVSSSQRLLAYLQPMWGADSLQKWATLLDSKTALNRGAKTLLEKMTEDTPVNFQVLLELFQPDALAHLLGVDQADLAGMAVTDYNLLSEFVRLDGQTLYNYSLTAKKKALEYPVKIAQVRGAATLAQPINLEVGTIHSFKGGQFDSIYIVPDLSVKSAREWQARGPGRDAIIRMMYVALTRAKIKATVLQNAQQFYVRL